jgi:hypothetical protein
MAADDRFGPDSAEAAAPLAGIQDQRLAWQPFRHRRQRSRHHNLFADHDAHDFAPNPVAPEHRHAR